MRTILSHVSVEMHTNLIISPHYDSLLCWLVRCLLCQGVQFGLFFSQFSCRTLIACRWTTSCYRMCVMRRQWLPWRTPLIWFTWKWPNQDQYISMICMPLQTTPAVRIYHLVVFFPHSSITIHGQPALVTVHIWMFSTRNQFFFSLRYVWWASSVDLGSLFSPQNCYAHTPT